MKKLFKNKKLKNLGIKLFVTALAITPAIMGIIIMIDPPGM